MYTGYFGYGVFVDYQDFVDTYIDDPKYKEEYLPDYFDYAVFNWFDDNMEENVVELSSDQDDAVFIGVILGVDGYVNWCDIKAAYNETDHVKAIIKTMTDLDLEPSFEVFVQEW